MHGSCRHETTVCLIILPHGGSNIIHSWMGHHSRAETSSTELGYVLSHAEEQVCLDVCYGIWAYILFLPSLPSHISDDTHITLPRKAICKPLRSETISITLTPVWQDTYSLSRLVWFVLIVVDLFNQVISLTDAMLPDVKLFLVAEGRGNKTVAMTFLDLCTTPQTRPTKLALRENRNSQKSYRYANINFGYCTYRHRPHHSC